MRAFCSWQSERVTCGCTLQSHAKQEQGHSAEARERAVEASSPCALAATELRSMQELSRDQPPTASPSAPAAPGSRSRAEELPHSTQAMGHSSPAMDAGRDAVPPKCNDTAAELELSPESGADVHEWPPSAPSAGVVDAQQSASIAPAADVMLAAGCREPAADDAPTAEGRQHAMPANVEEAAAVAHWGQSPSVIGRELHAPVRPLDLTMEPSEDCASAGTHSAMCVVFQNMSAAWNVMDRLCLANAGPGAGAGTAIGDLFSSFTAFACLGQQHSDEAQSQDGAGLASAEPRTGTMSAPGSSGEQTPSWHALAVHSCVGPALAALRRGVCACGQEDFGLMVTCKCCGARCHASCAREPVPTGVRAGQRVASLAHHEVVPHTRLSKRSLCADVEAGFTCSACQASASTHPLLELKPKRKQITRKAAASGQARRRRVT